MAKVYLEIARRLIAHNNCVKSGNVEWRRKHSEALRDLTSEHLLSGSGFDSGTTFDLEWSKPERLVFNTSYHHMDDSGYIGWSEHDVVVVPSLAFGFDLRVTGRDWRGIKEYIGECFQCALDIEI